MTRNPALRPPRTYVETLEIKASTLRLATYFAAGYVLGSLFMRLFS